MDAQWYPKRYARICREFTGEPYQYLRGLSADARPGLLPDADEDQAIVEAQVMEHLGGGSQWWAHPLGFASLRISTAFGIVINLDHFTVLSNDRFYDMARFALDRLLPYAEVGLQVNGAIGLRVDRVAGRDLVLRSVVGTGRVILRGVAGTNWSQLLKERWEDFASDPAFVPLWGEPVLTAHEQDHIDQYALTWRADQRLAWIGSALLRRVRLFETHSLAYSTRSWITGDEWIFELDTANDVTLKHDLLLDRLTEKPWGLAVEISSSSHCDCASAAEQRRRPHCTFYLGNDQGLEGTIQLRFRSVSVSSADRQDERQTLVRVGADARWLDRVLPESAGRSRRQNGGGR